MIQIWFDGNKLYKNYLDIDLFMTWNSISSKSFFASASESTI